MAEGDELKSQKEEEAHLFVLVHGLWGGPNHMLTIERAILELLPATSKEKIVTLKPSSFRFWKTYDGIEINAHRVIKDILYEIEILKQKSNYKVVKFSIVGYSLGGLIARFIIGEFFRLGFFDTVKPVFFTTFATPHVGVEFFKNFLFDKAANEIGRYLFGPSGKQLFVADDERLLVKLADPEGDFFKGLSLFEKHILLSNVRNDRTVAFFTSFITEYSPFDNWNTVRIKYLKDLLQSRIGKMWVRPKVVDLLRTTIVREERNSSFNVNAEVNSQEETSIFRSNVVLRYFMISVVALFLIPIWIPFVLISSLVASLYSLTKVRIIDKPNVKEHWTRVFHSVYGSSPIDIEDAKIALENRNKRKKLADHESFKGDTSNLTENTMEGIMYAEERFTTKASKRRERTDDNDGDGTQSAKDSLRSSSPDDDTAVQNTVTPRDEDYELKLFFIDTEGNDRAMQDNHALLTSKEYLKFDIFTPSSRLNLGNDKSFIVRSLNKIPWVKIPVYIDAWNSHDGIVARRGPKTNPKGTSTIFLWVSLLRNHLQSSTNTSP